MPYKNDNLEELFKKAADDYPLITNSSKWNSVANKLNIPITENTAAKKSNKWKYAVILICFLTGGGLLYTTYFKSTNNINHSTKAQANNKSQKNLNATQPVPLQKERLNSAVNNAGYSSSSKTNTALNNFTVLHKRDSKNTASEYLKQNNPINNLKTEANSESVTLNSSIVPNVNQQQNQLLIPSIIDNGQHAEVNKSIINNTTSASGSSNSKSVIKYQQPLSKFYGSLYTGPEFSLIRFQHINAPGFKVGIALGYRINRKFNLELGLQREKLNYYTNGKYFDKSGLNIKDAVELENLNAKSSITSVPVTLRYNLQSKNNSHFYIGAGFNALVLTHTESYQYTVNKNGNENDHSKSYKSVTGPKYFTSINANAGYENKLNNWCNFKIEPYYQLPVSNLGVGKLPVTSFGINIGIVKNLK